MKQPFINKIPKPKEPEQPSEPTPQADGYAHGAYWLNGNEVTEKRYRAQMELAAKLEKEDAEKLERLRRR